MFSAICTCLGPLALAKRLLQVRQASFSPGLLFSHRSFTSGHKLQYNVNGFRVFILNHILFFVLSSDYIGIKLFQPTIIYDNWYQFLLRLVVV
jgi:hypothetical protein